jgi:hypothetical protein
LNPRPFTSIKPDRSPARLNPREHWFAFVGSPVDSKRRRLHLAVSAIVGLQITTLEFRRNGQLPISRPCSLLLSASGAFNAGFQRTTIPDAKGNQAAVRLVFSDSKETIEASADGHVLLEVPYSSVDGFPYEYTQRHRVTQGAVVMVASLGAGAVVMLTESIRKTSSLDAVPS